MRLWVWVPPDTSSFSQSLKEVEKVFLKCMAIKKSCTFSSCMKLREMDSLFFVWKYLYLFLNEMGIKSCVARYVIFEKLSREIRACSGKYSNTSWDNDEECWKKWCEFKTGGWFWLSNPQILIVEWPPNPNIQLSNPQNWLENSGSCTDVLES